MNFVKMWFLAGLILSTTACMSPDPSKIASTYMVPLAQAPETEATWFQPGDTIIKQEVVAERVVSLSTNDYLSTLNRKKAPESASDRVYLHLTKMKDGSEVYCLPVSFGDNSPMKQFLMRNSKKITCLQDSDNDGMFDRKSRFHTNLNALPIVIGKASKTKPMDQPVPYRHEARNLAEKYYIEVKYLGRPMLKPSQRNFGFMGSISGSKPRALTNNHNPLVIDTLPVMHQINGSKFEVLETDGDKIKVRVLSTVPVSPFTIFRTVTYTFY